MKTPTRFQRLLQAMLLHGIEAALFGLVCYAVIHGLLQIGTVPPRLRESSQENQVQSLLFSTPTGVDIYNLLDKRDADYAYFDQGIFSVTDREPGFFVDKERQLPLRQRLEYTLPGLPFTVSPQRLNNAFQDVLTLSNDRNLVVRTETGISLYVPEEKRLYELLRVKNVVDAAMDRHQLRLVYVTRQGISAALNILYPGCQRTETVSITENREDVSQELQQWSLPVQHMLKFSPSQDRVLVLDHTISPRVFLYDILNDTWESLSAPGMGKDQRQFSALFLDDDTVAFSAMDASGWKTVSYDVNTRAYKTLSPRFSDGIFVSNTGMPVLVQSVFSLGKSNVPFGSRILYRERGLIPGNVVEALLPSEAERNQLFVKKTGGYRFHASETADSFKAIADLSKRTATLALWKSVEDPKTEVQVNYLLSRFDGSEYRDVREVAVRETNGAAYSLFLRNVTALLDVMEVSENGRRIYAEQRDQLAKENVDYLLIGSFR
jgi:hypothetical protein